MCSNDIFNYIFASCGGGRGVEVDSPVRWLQLRQEIHSPVRSQQLCPGLNDGR